MGCLKNLISFAILVFAIIGFFAVGGQNFFMNGMNGLLNPSQQKMLEKAQKVADFSAISKNYKIKRAVDMLGIKAVLIEHDSTKQKIIVADAAQVINLTQEDIKSNKIEQKLQQSLDKFTFIPIKIGALRVVGKSKIQALGKTIPCVKIKANLTGLPYKGVEGVLAVVSQKDGTSRIIGSFGEDEKFNFKIAETFFKELKQN